MKSSLTPVLRVPDSRGGSAIANPENINAAIGPGPSLVTNSAFVPSRHPLKDRQLPAI